MEQRKVGRPKGVPFPVRKLLRMSEEHGEELHQLAEWWGCSEAEAMRRAIRETLRREKRKGAE